MKTIFRFACYFSLCAVALQSCTASRDAKPLPDAMSRLSDSLSRQRVLLPNGWSLTPVGRTVPLRGDLPLNLAVSPSKKLIAVTNNGNGRQSITLIDIATEKVLDDVEIAKSWVGLAFGSDEQFLYASGGNDNTVVIYKIDSGKLRRDSVIALGTPGVPWPKEKISPGGMALDSKRNLLYICTKEDSSLYTCDLASRRTVGKLKLDAEPYTAVLSPDAATLYISLWGGDQVLCYDVATQKITAAIPTESHPNDMTLTADGSRLFVANANSNSVSIIDTPSKKVIETVSAALYPAAPTGSTTNGLSLSADERTLYVANADNNCLAVFDVSRAGESRSMGFIPVGWYPAAVLVAGSKIFVANGKGTASLPNPKGPQPDRKSGNTDGYIGRLFKGSLSIIDAPDARMLALYSKLVYDNTPYSKALEVTASGEAGNPVPREAGSSSPIKYVFYVIKENRTYDQMFGDVKEGNGDSSLCLFPEPITPNHHALAREFVLLDNFYVDAEVSADGHNWSMAAYATDFVEKTWPSNYSGRGGNYDYEGGRKIAEPKAGFIWDYCQRAGVSYRSYGEFVHNGKATVASLAGHVAAAFPTYNLDIMDTVRERIWEKDFDSLVAAGAVPQFNIIRLPNDHTSGARTGKRTPQAFVADNDLALGRFIEHLSRSSVWKESAVFVLEDDAQNGPDHVDAHRSIAFVISPYTKRRNIDHTMYSTSSMLRTMELILGLPPMSQYDAAATPMWRCFTAVPDFTPYVCKPAAIDLGAKNLAVNESSRRSQMFNLAKEDAAPDIEFNEVIWKTIKGESSAMPAPRRSAFVKLSAKDDDDD